MEISFKARRYKEKQKKLALVNESGSREAREGTLRLLIDIENVWSGNLTSIGGAKSNQNISAETDYLL